MTIKIPQTSTGSDSSVSIYCLATNCGNQQPRFRQPSAASCASISLEYLRRVWNTFMWTTVIPGVPTEAMRSRANRPVHNGSSRVIFQPMHNGPSVEIILLWFGPYANLFLSVGNVASNSGMYVNFTSTLQRILPRAAFFLSQSFILAKPTNYLTTMYAIFYLFADIYKHLTSWSIRLLTLL